LNPYLDRALTEEDILQVQSHLEACRGCLHLFRFEASVRRLVRVRCQQMTAPETLRVRVLAALGEQRARRARLQTKRQARRPIDNS
jgi:mycothiol system anti-sigma-R factor